VVAKERGDDSWIEAVTPADPDGNQGALTDEGTDRTPRLTQEGHQLRRVHQGLPPLQFVDQCHKGHAGLIPVTVEIPGK